MATKINIQKALASGFLNMRSLMANGTMQCGRSERKSAYQNIRCGTNIKIKLKTIMPHKKKIVKYNFIMEKKKYVAISCIQHNFFKASTHAQKCNANGDIHLPILCSIKPAPYLLSKPTCENSQIRVQSKGLNRRNSIILPFIITPLYFHFFFLIKTLYFENSTQLQQQKLLCYFDEIAIIGQIFYNVVSCN